MFGILSVLVGAVAVSAAVEYESHRFETDVAYHMTKAQATAEVQFARLAGETANLYVGCGEDGGMFSGYGVLVPTQAGRLPRAEAVTLLSDLAGNDLGQLSGYGGFITYPHGAAAVKHQAEAVMRVGQVQRLVQAIRHGDTLRLTQYDAEAGDFHTHMFAGTSRQNFDAELHRKCRILASVQAMPDQNRPAPASAPAIQAL